MRLAFITAIKTPSTDAQSLQVMAMAKAFHQILGGDFIFVSPHTTENKKLSALYRWRRVRAPLWPRFLRYASILAATIGIIRQEKITKVYTRDILVAVWVHFLGKKAIYEMHKPFETILGKLFFKLVKNRILLVTISAALKTYVEAELGVPERSISVAHDGVWLADYVSLDRGLCQSKLRRLLKIENHSRAIALYAGNLAVGGKGIELIRAAAISLPDVIFVIVGGVITACPANVVFLGRVPVNRIPALLVGADLLLLPFTRELKTWRYHSALKMFEYMASGTPVVASRLGSITEVLNQKNSFLFAPDSVGDFTRQIRSALDTSAETRSRADQAFSDVKKFDWLCRAGNIINFIR